MVNYRINLNNVYWENINAHKSKLVFVYCSTIYNNQSIINKLENREKWVINKVTGVMWKVNTVILQWTEYR